MTQDEIQMPSYLNAAYEGDDLYTGDQVRKLIKLVAAAAASKEREACALICDGLHYEVDAYGAQCAEAIRARGAPTSRGEA